MDVDAVEQIGRGLQTDAEALAALTTKVDALVRRLPGLWEGKDANDFVSIWWPQHRRSLQEVRSNIAGLGQSALNNASEQREASDAGTAVATGGAAAAVSGVAAGGANVAAGSGTPPGGVGASLPSSAGGADRYTAALDDPHSVVGRARANGEDYQCASWASFRRAELGLTHPGGNGFEQAGRIGLVDAGQAGVGSVVSTGTSTWTGHVMVVEEKQSGSPLTFRVSEMNTGLDGSDAYHASAAEYRDNTIIRQRADGSWEASRGGRAFVRMASSPRFSSN
ncbi:MAG: CHAP domain-containing protein [Actinobacteria bacterium]|nr:CHAP domain-containing protein [Actinomycetota bacterium]